MAKKIAPASDRTVTTGDNLQVSPELLGISHTALTRRLEALERKSDQVERIDSDDESGPWQEVIADMDTLGRDIESTRVEVKDPFERAVETVNGFFFAIHAPRKGQTPGRLQKARAKIAEQVIGYINRKEAAERARLAEVARVERLREEAAIEKQRLERQKVIAAQDAERSRAASNALAREAEAKADRDAAAARAFEAEQQALAKPADLSRVRSDGGTLASTKVEWDFRIDDIERVKGAPLWQYVSRTAKEQAVRAWIRANAPKVLPEGEEYQPLAGVTLISKRGLQVR